MISLWLNLDPGSAEKVSRDIKRLAEHYDSVVFPPHITLYGAVKLNSDQILDLIGDSLKEIRQFSVKSDWLGDSEVIWKTVFINILMNHQLQNLSNICRAELGKYRDYDFQPHISLIYKLLSKKTRKKIIKSVKIEEQYIISGVSLVDISGDIADWHRLKTITWN